MTVRDRIFAAITDRLEAAGIAASVELMPTADGDVFPVLHLFDQGQSILETEAGTDRLRLALTIEGFVSVEGGEGAGRAAHAALNALHAGTVLALFADDATPGAVLGGLAEFIELGDLAVSGAALADRRNLAFVQEIFVTFATRRGDPATAP